MDQNIDIGSAINNAGEIVIIDNDCYNHAAADKIQEEQEKKEGGKRGANDNQMEKGNKTEKPIVGTSVGKSGHLLHFLMHQIVRYTGILFE